MRKQVAAGLVVLCLVLSLSAGFKTRAERPVQDPLLDQKVELHLRKVTFMQVLGTLAVDRRIPTGIEYSPQDQNDEKMTLETDGSSLREILDSIVKQEPLYRWEVVDGVINFVPVSDRDPFFEALLSTKVANYEPGKWTVKFELRDAIEKTPEVKKLLDSKHVELAKYRDYNSYPSIYTERDVDLRMSNTTVRGILNRIVKVSEHKRWSLGWRKGEKNVFSIWL